MQMTPIIRRAVYFLAFAFSVIGFGAGINAAVKTADQKVFVDEHVPVGFNVSITNVDITATGAFLLIGSFGLGLSALLALIFDFLPTRNTLFTRFGGFVLAFWTAWVFILDIANTAISRGRSASVDARLQGTDAHIPNGIIEQTEKMLGVSPKYWDHPDVRFFAIVTWFTFAFGAAATFVAFKASRPAPNQKSMEFA